MKKLKLREEVKNVLGIGLFYVLLIITTITFCKQIELQAQKNTAEVPVQTVQNISR